MEKRVYAAFSRDCNDAVLKSAVSLRNQLKSRLQNVDNEQKKRAIFSLL